ncbi:MAG: LytS/YhcK type 5TM receptor domain-containing protein [Anaerolineae bacterium]|nr:LytS/YhcK type 5TM receptor domain-containing protein [Anaerolineae bacterium]
MNSATIFGLINNAALLLALGVLYNVVGYRKYDQKNAIIKLLTGSILGGIGVVVMMSPWEFAPGIVFDTRSVLLSISGLFFGPLPTLQAMLMTSIYRIIIGGTGTLTGVMVICFSGAIGIGWRHFRHWPSKNLSLLELYFMGLVVHIFMLLAMLTLPRSISQEVLTTISLPVMTISPVITSLLGMLLVNQENRTKNEKELRTLHAASQALKRTLNLDEIYISLFQFIQRLMPCDGFFVSDYDIQTKTISCRAAWADGAWLDVASFPPIPLEPEGKGTQSIAIRTGQSLLLNDYDQFVRSSQHRYYVNSESKVYEEIPDDVPRTRSALIVPLIVDNQVTGVLQVFSDRVNVFYQNHLRLLESLSVHVASAIQNAELYQASQREVAERRKTELALSESEAKYRLLANNTVDVIWQMSPQLEFTYVNPSIFLLTGYTPQEWIGTRLRDHCDDVNYQAIVNAMQQDLNNIHADPDQSIVFEVELLKKNGDPISVEITGKYLMNQEQQLVALQGTTRDITERIHAQKQLQEYAEQLEERVEDRTQELKKAQERLLRQERLSVLGQIAGSIAHELRNPLGAIKNAAYALNMILDSPDTSVQSSLAVINREIHTSDRIITSLLNFTRPQQPVHQKIDIRNLIDHVLSRIEIPPDVDLQIDMDNDPADIQADPRHLEQIYGNLFLNGLQAMPNGGKLTIAIHEVNSLPEHALAGFLPDDQHQPASWMTISVTDTGVGISDEHVSRLFEPLFTTKITGLGLGLALVKLLIAANDGGIVVESTPGQGTTFQTIWPALTQNHET